jgi:hypothetical protein
VKSAFDVYFEFKESASIKTVNVCANKFVCTAMYRYSEDFIVVDYPDNSVGVFYAENLNLKSQHKLGDNGVYFSAAFKGTTDIDYLILGFGKTMLLVDGSNDHNNKMQMKNKAVIDGADIRSFTPVLKGA